MINVASTRKRNLHQSDISWAPSRWKQQRVIAIPTRYAGNQKLVVAIPTNNAGNQERVITDPTSHGNQEQVVAIPTNNAGNH